MEPGEVGLFPRPTPLPTDLVGWLTTFARKTFLSAYTQAEADTMMKEVAEICRPDAYWCTAMPGAGEKPPASATSYEEGWEVMYVRIRGVGWSK